MPIDEAIKTVIEYCESKEYCKSCKFVEYKGLCALRMNLPCDWGFLLEMEEKKN